MTRSTLRCAFAYSGSNPERGSRVAESKGSTRSLHSLVLRLAQDFALREPRLARRVEGLAQGHAEPFGSLSFAQGPELVAGRLKGVEA